MAILVDADSVSASRPGRMLFDRLSVTISATDRLGLVGLNGTGKSTLLRVLAGTEPPESGTLRRGRDTRVVMLEQRPALGEGRVRDVVAPPDGAGEWEVEAVLDRLGMTSKLEADVTTLSGGEAKRVALARALVHEAELLLLDEPTNHLDIDAISWLEDRLASFRGGLVIVTHDRHVLDRVATRVLELDRGRAHVHEGGYDAYLEALARRVDEAAEADAVRRNLARRELAWLRRGAKARTRKPKARRDAAEQLVATRAEAPERAGPLDLHIGTPRLGDKVIDLDGVGHRWGDDDAWLFRSVELSLGRRARVGVVGVNGSGKSTLLDVIAGRIEPREGSCEHGPTVDVGYYDQIGRALDPDATVGESVTGGREPTWHDVAFMERFWFDADAQRSPVSLLSGGERRRLQLVLVLAARPNVLLLDEPTNDLDLDTLRVLEDFLDGWPGALVVVGHDRAFLERTVDEVVVLGGGEAQRWPGGYAAWEEQRRTHAPTARPTARTPATRRADPGRPTDRRRQTGRSRSTLRHRLRQTEDELHELELERERLATEIDAHRCDHEALARLGAELEQVQSELEGREEEWLELSEELEAFDGSDRR